MEDTLEEVTVLCEVLVETTLVLYVTVSDSACCTTVPWRVAEEMTSFEFMLGSISMELGTEVSNEGDF